MSSLYFQRLVATLRRAGKTCVTVEQCCGGTISSNILAQPGASSVYWGGSTIYNTRHAKALLLNNEELHQQLINPTKQVSLSEAEQYIQAKVQWTAKTSVAFCEELQADYAIAEGGASGPTFRPKDMTTGFAVVAVAGRQPDGRVVVLRQEIVRSPHANRIVNMRFFADRAAKLATKVVMSQEGTMDHDDSSSLPKDLSVETTTATTTTISPNLNRRNEPSVQLLQLDRATHLRSNPVALAEWEQSDTTRYVVVKGNRIVVRQSSSSSSATPMELALLNGDEMRDVTRGKTTQTTFLGIVNEQEQTYAAFGVDLLDDDAPGDDKNRVSSDSSFSLVDTRTTAPLFTPLHNELALHATALAQWQRRTRHCTQCGGRMDLVDAGTSSQCQQCHTKSWPRQDPSMIVLVSSRDQQRVLLARSPRHPPKLHTVLAGFVEAGETFEAAVAREVWEETGVRVDADSIRYVGSQPWPFPQSCMIGFTATADDTAHAELNIDPQEIVSAGWFDRSVVEHAARVPGATMQRAVAEEALARDPSLSLLVPPRGVIARRLIDLWLKQEQAIPAAPEQ